MTGAVDYKVVCFVWHQEIWTKKLGNMDCVFCWNWRWNFNIICTFITSAKIFEYFSSLTTMTSNNYKIKFNKLHKNVKQFNLIHTHSFQINLWSVTFIFTSFFSMCNLIFSIESKLISSDTIKIFFHDELACWMMNKNLIMGGLWIEGHKA